MSSTDKHVSTIASRQFTNSSALSRFDSDFENGPAKRHKPPKPKAKGKRIKKLEFGIFVYKFCNELTLKTMRLLLGLFVAQNHIPNDALYGGQDYFIVTQRQNIRDFGVQQRVSVKVTREC